MHNIQIEAAKNGVIARVGCWTLVFNDITQFSLELNRYLTNPEQVEKEYHAKFGSKSDQIGAILRETEQQAYNAVPTQAVYAGERNGALGGRY